MNGDTPGASAAAAAGGRRRESPDAVPPEPSVVLREVSKWYGPVIGLNRMSLSIGPGITGLVGPNGAGKSTLLRVVTGQLRPSLGEVRLLGRSLVGRPSLRRLIGFCPQENQFPDGMTGRAFVLAMARLSGLGWLAARRRTEAELARVGMSALAGRQIAACSQGMKQRLKFAQALVHDPVIAIFDEPLAGVDPGGRADLIELLREVAGRGRTVIVSSHILHEVEQVCDKLVLMARGRQLAQGRLRDIRTVLGEHPLTVRIDSRAPRPLAAALLELPQVVSVAVAADERSLTVRARDSRALFASLPHVVVEGEHAIEGMEVLDASAEAVFGYLLRAHRPLPDQREVP